MFNHRIELLAELTCVFQIMGKISLCKYPLWKASLVKIETISSFDVTAVTVPHLINLYLTTLNSVLLLKHTERNDGD